MKLPHLILAAITALALACTSDAPTTPPPSPTPTIEVTATPPTASPTATPEPPTQTPTTSPADRTRSLEAVDLVIAAVEARDVGALETLVRYTRVPCDGEKSFEGPPYPACEGAPFATPVDAFPAGTCGPVWYRDPHPMIERFVERAGPLFAVIESPIQPVEAGVPSKQQLSTGDYRVIFTAAPVGRTVAYVAVLEDQRLTALWFGCGTPSDGLLKRWNPSPALIRQGPAFVTPTPTPEETPVPSPDLAPRGTRTGNAEIDGVIEAMESGDPTVIRALLRTTTAQCTYAPQIGSALCEDGELEATSVDVFLFTACEGFWGRLDADGVAQDLASWNRPLAAVAAPPAAGDWYQLRFASESPDTFGGPVIYIEAGSIIGRGGGCSTLEEWASWSHIILRGPAWPEDAP